MSLLSISTSALAASQAMLTVTGNNIANVNTAGYSIERADLVQASGTFSGSGYYGSGVNVQTVTRAHADFLTTQAATTQSQSSADAARASSLQQLQQIFPIGANGLGTAVNTFFNSLSDLASSPNDTTVRTVVLSNARQMTASFQTASSQLDALDQATQSQLSGDVNTINSLTTQIATINQQVANATATGQSPNQLLDQRDQLVSDLNKQIQTTSIPAADGTVNLFVAGGQALVVGNSANKLSIGTDPSNPSQSVLSVQQPGQSLSLSSSAIGGGEVAGLMRFRNTDMVSARNQLGGLALAVGNTLNSQHALGVDLNGNAGGTFFSIPINDGFANANNTGSAHLQVTLNDPNGTALQPSDYRVDFSSASAGTVTRLSDNTVVSSFNSLPIPTPIDGLNISVASGTAAAGDSFLIQPRQAAAQMSVALTSPRQIAATPVSFAFGAQNSGTLNVASLSGPQVGAAQAAQTNPYVASPVTLTFTAAGTFNVVGDGTGNPTGVSYTAGAPISYNGWNLTLNGTPNVGDTITVEPFASVGNTGSPLLGGTPLSGYYADMLTQIGTTVQTAQSAAAVSKSIASQAEQSRSSASSVNLDEEAAKLIQYQQSYQAAGKLLQVSQTLWTSLIQTIG